MRVRGFRIVLLFLVTSIGQYSFPVVPCQGGWAGIYPCSGVDLLAHLPLNTIGGGAGNDVWGWTDPVTGKDYALVGRSTGTSFVDISDPGNPTYLGNLPTQTSSSTWRDIKVYANHAFVVADSAGDHGMQVFDLTQLRSVQNPPVTFSPTAVYEGFGSAHNIAVNPDSGFLYAVDSGTCGNGLHMVDVLNPAQPVFAGCHSSDGTIHDAQCVTYHGPDEDRQGSEICFTATLSSDTMDIIDVTDKSQTVTLSKNSYPGATIPHQGWLTEDHTFFLHGDEGDETSFQHNTRTHIFDVSDLDNPEYLGAFTGSLPAIDHNQYVREGFLYQANYTIGMRILDLVDIANANLSEVAFFDTRPESDGQVYQGAWSVYPYFESCYVVVNDMQRGLFVLQPNTLCVCGNGVREGSEVCDGTDFGGLACTDLGCSGGSLHCTVDCAAELTNCTDCSVCDFDGTCGPGEDCGNCPTDCVSGSSSGPACGNGVCEAGDGEDCLSCPDDCNGKQIKGNPDRFYCCGDGDGINPVGCSDSRCSSSGSFCTSNPSATVSYCCGDLVCEGEETSAICEVDCGTSSCIGGQLGDPCTVAGDCCSGKCTGKPDQRTCK